MHQFRDKSVAQRQLASAGLLMYPVLQTADVLAYRANEVPVGEDQRRVGARPPGARAQDVDTGGTEQGTVFVDDEPDASRRKFKRAVTDSGSEVLRGDDKPGSRT